LLCCSSTIFFSLVLKKVLFFYSCYPSRTSMLDASHNSSQEFQPKKKNLLGSFSLSWKNKVTFFLPESKQLSDMRHHECSCARFYVINLLDKQLNIPFYSAMKQWCYSIIGFNFISTVWLRSQGPAGSKNLSKRMPGHTYQLVCNKRLVHVPASYQGTKNTFFTVQYLNH
jgi:hypothetical protein